MQCVFVYGTLKRGYGNHYLLENSKFLGEYTLDANMGFTLIDSTNGAFPAAVKVDKKLSPIDIHGEVFCVDDETMQRLDWLEGYPDFYNRSIIKLNTDVGDECWIYFWPESDVSDEVEVITEGVW